MLCCAAGTLENPRPPNKQHRLGKTPLEQEKSSSRAEVIGGGGTLLLVADQVKGEQRLGRGNDRKRRGTG